MYVYVVILTETITTYTFFSSFLSNFYLFPTYTSGSVVSQLDPELVLWFVVGLGLTTS